MAANSFARRQLERYGWEHGKGLGRTLSGGAEAIKVKVKQNKDGLPLLVLVQLGKEPDQMGFAWWDHVYNKAASNIIIDSDSDKEQIVCKTKKQRDRTEIVTTRLPDADELAVQKKQKAKKTKAAAASSSSDEGAAEAKPAAAAAATVAAPPRTESPLYSLFVRAAPLVPLTPDQAKAAANGAAAAGSESSDADSDPEDEDALRDYSTQLDDATLLKVCEGRQLGQRGGYKQTAKQERLARQEQELLERLKAARAAARAEARAAKAGHEAAASDVSASEAAADQDKKKKKKKKRTDAATPAEEEPPAEVEAAAEIEEPAKRKKKKRARDAEADGAASEAAAAEADEQPKKSKKKQRRTEADAE